MLEVRLKLWDASDEGHNSWPGRLRSSEVEEGDAGEEREGGERCVVDLRAVDQPENRESTGEGKQAQDAFAVGTRLVKGEMREGGEAVEAEEVIGSNREVRDREGSEGGEVPPSGDDVEEGLNVVVVGRRAEVERRRRESPEDVERFLVPVRSSGG